MPRKIKTRCNHRGCRKATRGAYCPEHAHLAYYRPSERHRGTAAERGYDYAWSKLRRAYIAENPCCEDCLEEGAFNDTGIDVDHIVPIHVAPDLRLKWDNLRSRCRRHHRLKTIEDEERYGSFRTSRETGS